MILEARHLAHSKPVRALTYLDVYALSRQQLFDILDDYPATRKVCASRVCLAWLRLLSTHPATLTRATAMVCPLSPPFRKSNALL